MTRIDWRLVGAVSLVGLVCLLWLALAAVLLRAVLDPADWQAIVEALGGRGGLLLFLWALALVPVSWALRHLFEHHVLAPARLAEQVRAALSAGVQQPLVPTGSAETRDLTVLVNALVAQREALRNEMELRVEQATRAVELERRRLAALMAELTKSVVVCNLDGRIVLYNNRARLQFKALSQTTALTAGPELIGLGRSVYTVLDRGLVSHALEDVERRLRRGAMYPAAQFVTTTPAGRRLRVYVTPVREQEDTGVVATGEAPLISGFVLLIENIIEDRETATVATPALAEAVLPLEEIPDDELLASPHDSRPEYYPEHYDFDLLRTSTLTAQLEDTALTQLAYTVFDTETTGLEPSRGDEILQVGAVRIVNGRVLAGECFDQLVDPGRGIPAAGIPIHGITPDMVRGQPGIAEVLPAFHAFCGDTVLVAHNAAFDMRFLELKQSHVGVVFDQPVLDTLLLSAVIHEHQRSHRLEAIAERFGLQVIGRHTAIGDALLTAEIFLRLLPLLASRGIVTLGQALEASRQTYFARQRY